MFELMPFRRNNTFGILDDFEKRFWNGISMNNFSTDIRDAGNSLILEAELPGFEKEDIKIDVEDEYLTISAERNSAKDEKDENGSYLRRERTYGSFSRSFSIANVKADEITAEYKHGILTVTLPKKEAEKPISRRLEIK